MCMDFVSLAVEEESSNMQEMVALMKNYKRMKLHFTASWLIERAASDRQLTLESEEISEYIAQEFEAILESFFAQGLETSRCTIKPERKRHKQSL